MSEEFTPLDRATVERELVRMAARSVRQAADNVSNALASLNGTEYEHVEVSVTWRCRDEALYTKVRRIFDELMDAVERIETADGDALARVVQEFEAEERAFTERTQRPEAT